MNRRLTKRLTSVEQNVAKQPISNDVLAPAVDTFRETGELPDNDRLAAAVLRVAQDSYLPVYKDDGALDWAATIQATMQAKKRRQDRVLEGLYAEAIHAPTVARNAARMVLRAIATLGRDPAEPLFREDYELPEDTFIGLHMLGFPERLIAEPYEEQAQRLIERIHALYRRQPGNRRWSDALRDAMEDFAAFGMLPEDELLRATVLAQGEANALLMNLAGEDVGELMALYAKVDDGNASDETLGKLADLVVESAR